MAEMKSILVAIDFSTLSSRVLDYAQSLAAVWAARLQIVHVVHDLSYFTGLPSADAILAELQQRLEEEARERLEALCQSVLGEPLDYETLVVTGRPLDEIRRLIEQHAVDCLVLGAHSTDKPEHQLFGSTAEHLLQHMSCPVLLIPPHPRSAFISQG